MAAVGVPVCATKAEEYNDDSLSASTTSQASTETSAVISRSEKKKGTGITIDQLKKNPALTKLLIMAAKKIKSDK